MFVTWDVATAIHGRYQADICDIKHMYVVKCVMFGFKINDKTHYRELYFLIISIPVFLTYTYKSTFWYYWKVAYHNAGDYPILISVISEIAIIYCVLMKSIKYFFLFFVQSVPSCPSLLPSVLGLWTSSIRWPHTGSSRKNVIFLNINVIPLSVLFITAIHCPTSV